MNDYQPHPTTVIALEPDDEMLIPRMEIVVHPTVALLNEWRDHKGMADHGGEEARDSYGITTYDHDPEQPDLVPFQVHLAADGLYLSVVSHEATHVALFDYDRYVLSGIPGARASAHIGNHDETIPYTVGNVTALIWYQLLQAGFEPAEDGDDMAAPGIP